MEHCYRMTLWMFCIAACIQATPIPQCSVPIEDDLSLDQLHEAECGNNKFLVDVNETNCSVAMNCIYYELDKASKSCNDSNHRIGRMMTTIAYYNTIEAASYSCPWTTEKNFTEFVKNIDSIFQKLQA